MALSYNLGYQESISVHPTRRQNFAGKVCSNFPNIWEWLIYRYNDRNKDKYNQLCHNVYLWVMRTCFAHGNCHSQRRHFKALKAIPYVWNSTSTSNHCFRRTFLHLQIHPHTPGLLKDISWRGQGLGNWSLFLYKIFFLDTISYTLRKLMWSI